MCIISRNCKGLIVVVIISYFFRLCFENEGGNGANIFLSNQYLSDNQHLIMLTIDKLVIYNVFLKLQSSDNLVICGNADNQNYHTHFIKTSSS